jgi:hypothetical protein
MNVYTYRRTYGEKGDWIQVDTYYCQETTHLLVNFGADTGR